MTFDTASYLALVTSQYQMSPNFMAFLSVPLDKLIDIDDAIADIEDAFDIDDAVGDQLDILGELLGQSRTVDFEPSGSVSPILIDEVYRVLLKAKIGRNQWNGQIADLQQLWLRLFPHIALIVQDNQDMSLNVLYVGDLSTIEVDLITHGLIVPRPQGVLINYYYASDFPVFAYDETNSYFDGYDSGKWLVMGFGA